MLRNLSLAVVVTVFGAAAADARIVVPVLTPVEKTTRAEVAVVGTVTAIEKDTVIAENDRGYKVAHRIAVLKVETVLLGANVPKRLGIAFVPDADPKVFVRPPGRGGYHPVNLAVGHAGVFFLAKDASGEYYTINPAISPLDATANSYKADAELAEKAAAVLNEPMKALKAKNAADRFFAANVLLQKYRGWPMRETETALVSREESTAILKALAERNWKPEPDNPNGMPGFRLLGLTEKDGWTWPAAKPGEDFVVRTKDAYVKWLAGPGKDYQIKKYVPKKAEKRP